MRRAPEDVQQSFLLFGEYWAGLSVLTDAQRGRLLQALFAHHGFCDMPELDQAAEAVVAMMLPRMKANWEWYRESRRRRQEAGRKGGQAKAANAVQDEATPPDANGKVAMPSNAKQCQATPDNAGQCLHGTGTGTGTGSGTGAVSGAGTGSVSGSVSLSPPSPPQGGGRERRKPDLRGADFEEWYKAYPRHEKPADARRAWDKAARAGALPPLRDLLEALSWQREREQWQDSRYVPLPASYLNAQAWLDERPKAGRAARHAPTQEETAARRTAENFREYLDETYGPEGGDR